MKKKILALCLVVVLAVTAVTGVTLAYFTDTDKASNTFELGGVDITLTEKAYQNGKWEDIESPDGKATLGQLDPIDADDWAKITAAGYAYNKGVFTINNKDEAYIRNYVAVESLANNEGEDNVYEIWYNNAPMANPSEGGKLRHGAVLTATIENVKINNTYYDIYVFDTIDNAAVEKGDSFMTLSTVILQDWVTNEEIEALGDNFEVYTFSEAIQSTGLTHAEAMTALMGDDAALADHATRLISSMITG